MLEFYLEEIVEYIKINLFIFMNQTRNTFNFYNTSSMDIIYLVQRELLFGKRQIMFWKDLLPTVCNAHEQRWLIHDNTDSIMKS